MRTCSVCGTEIDKNTAYTVSGEQKAQGRRCINCVDGANKVEAAPAKPAAQPAKKAEVPAPSVSKPSASNAPAPEKKGISKTTYILAAIAIIVVLIALN